MKLLTLLPKIIKGVMTLGDIFPGMKTHMATSGVVLTALAPLVITVINPYMAGALPIVEAVTMGWPYVATILGAFGVSGIKAGMDRSKQSKEVSDDEIYGE